MANGQTSSEAEASVLVGNADSSFLAGGFLAGGAGDDLLIAEPLSWSAQLLSLNQSGVSGTAALSLTGDGLRVEISATGLEANQPHAMHIHGRAGADGAPLDSQPGTLALDTDNDSFVELAEGRVAQGPPILTLGEPTAGADGSLAFDQTFALDGQTFALDGMQDLFPLTFRLVEMHGLSVDAGDGAGTGGEVDGTAGFKPTLPVASGAIREPAAASDADPTEADPTEADPTEDGVLMAGDAGNDHLVGGHAADLLIGGHGDDVLAGGAGDDDLVGGSGADRFIVGEGKDAISDFQPDQGDRLAFGSEIELGDLVARQTPQGLWITIGDAPLSDPGSEGVLLVSVHVTSATHVSDWLV